MFNPTDDHKVDPYLVVLDVCEALEWAVDHTEGMSRGEYLNIEAIRDVIFARDPHTYVQARNNHGTRQGIGS